jgi:hypothetical protein
VKAIRETPSSRAISVNASTKASLEADTRRRPVGSTERLLPCSVGFLSLGIAIKPRGVPEVPFRKLALFATRPPLLGVREAGGGIFAQRCNQRGL